MRVRFGTPVPYDLLQKPDMLHEAIRITKENIRQAINAWVAVKNPDKDKASIPVLIQSLYNDTFIFSDALKRIVPTDFVRNDEGFMELVKDAAIKELKTELELKRPNIQLISSTHSINNTRSFAQSSKGMTEILKVGTDRLTALKDKQNTPEFKRLSGALDAYLKLQQPLFAQFPVIGPILSIFRMLNPDTSRNRQLELASLEQIIISESGGLAGGGCKSAKDRKAIETMHTDSMLIYQTTHSQFPDFSKPNDKEKFAEIFSNQFHSGLNQALADQNAPGAYGLKSVAGTLPDFLKDKIESDFKKTISQDNIQSALQFSNAAASLNRFKGKFSFKPFAKALKVAKPLRAAFIILASLPLLVPFTFFQTGARWALRQTIQAQLKNPTLTKQPWYSLMQFGAVLSSLTGLPTLLQWVQNILTQSKNHQAILKAREIVPKKVYFNSLPGNTVTTYNNLTPDPTVSNKISTTLPNSVPVTKTRSPLKHNQSLNNINLPQTDPKINIEPVQQNPPPTVVQKFKSNIQQEAEKKKASLDDLKKNTIENVKETINQSPSIKEKITTIQNLLLKSKKPSQ
jgi:hypothetical protein